MLFYHWMRTIYCRAYCSLLILFAHGLEFALRADRIQDPHSGHLVVSSGHLVVFKTSQLTRLDCLHHFLGYLQAIAWFLLVSSGQCLANSDKCLVSSGQFMYYLMIWSYQGWFYVEPKPEVSVGLDYLHRVRGSLIDQKKLLSSLNSYYPLLQNNQI